MAPHPTPSGRDGFAVPVGREYEAKQRAERLANRHPATTGILRYFEYEHLPERLQVISQILHDNAHEMVRRLPDGPELTAGLRKLLEAKDCFVRAALDAP